MQSNCKSILIRFDTIINVHKYSILIQFSVTLSGYIYDTNDRCLIAISHNHFWIPIVPENFCHNPDKCLYLTINLSLVRFLADSCIQTLARTSGTVTSPGYPGRYPDNLSCKWTIQAPVGQLIQMEVMNFDIESSPGCNADELVLIDGRSILLGR